MIYRPVRVAGVPALATTAKSTAIDWPIRTHLSDNLASAEGVERCEKNYAYCYSVFFPECSQAGAQLISSECICDVVSRLVYTI